ncbi:MAG TPA: O-antigen ligase family protein [Solirubrobacteraceae bacterium]|nr:O-antigen ligase family protein [Solirubrobacteraceae bacterium]
MTVFAVLSGPLPKLGVVVLGLLAAGAILDVEPRRRALWMLGALVLSPALLLADIWHSPQLHFVHHHPLYAAVGAVLALTLLGVAATLIARRPWLTAPLAVLALPFRVPIESGGTTSNLLVPLYFVVAAAALAEIVPALREDRPGPEAPARRWVERLLALYVVLYAIQATYSVDFKDALQNMVFFYVPFALLFTMLRRLHWTRELIVMCLQVVVPLAIVFACIGFVEYDTKTLLLNPKLIAANNLHTYFTVNSVFFDPDIFGRFLALVMIALAAVLIHARDRRTAIGTTVILAILWGGLVLTLSRSSMAALLVGLGILAALRWKVWPVLATAGVVVVIGAIALAVSPNTFGLNQGLNGASSGRANLVTGGLSMFGDEPLYGYGSGAFIDEYKQQHPLASKTLSASHTIPITIAAEQGLIGLLAYLALVIAAVIALLRGTRADPIRATIAAAFVALVFHTMLYADFLEDPVTWALLGIGCALAITAPLGRGDPAPEPAAIAA